MGGTTEAAGHRAPWEPLPHLGHIVGLGGGGRTYVNPGRGFGAITVEISASFMGDKCQVKSSMSLAIPNE